MPLSPRKILACDFKGKTGGYPSLSAFGWKDQLQSLKEIPVFLGGFGTIRKRTHLWERSKMPKRDREGHYFATFLSISYKSLTRGSACPLALPSCRVHTITCVKQLGLSPCQIYGRTISQATYGKEQVTIC